MKFSNKSPRWLNYMLLLFIVVAALLSLYMNVFHPESFTTFRQRVMQFRNCARTGACSTIEYTE